MTFTFTFGSLFSGLGGIDLGLIRAGMQCVWQVEIDEFTQQVLQAHFPDVAKFRDIRECGKHNLLRPHLIAGGFPCQPHSVAGKRKASADERDLWSEFYRIICELRPRWVLAENVPGVLSSEAGRFFGRILRDLAACGYDAEWRVLSAAQFGAPHRRERVFVVAYSGSIRECRTQGSTTTRQSSTIESAGVCGRTNTTEMANTNRQRCQEWGIASFPDESGHAPWETRFPGSAGLFEPGMGRMLNGFPTRLDGYQWPSRPGETQCAWEPPRTTQELIIHRSARLRALGNAVVPQVTEWIGRRILATVEDEQ